MAYEPYNADRGCNLECVQNKAANEFIGPVKIVFVDVPKSLYQKRMCLSGLLQIANMMIGATVVTVLFFTLSMKLSLIANLHIILCTFGFQLCHPSAIIMLSELNGASAHMKELDRKCQHLLLQVIGLLCAAGGTALCLLPDGKFQLSLTPHAIAGMGAILLTVVSSLNGLFVCCVSNYSGIGKCIGCTQTFIIVPAFIASSVCFILGLYFSDSFISWMPVPEIIYFLIFFCSSYTFIVSLSALSRCFSPPT